MAKNRRDYKRLNNQPKYIKRGRNKKRKATTDFSYSSHWAKLAKQDPNNQELQLLGLIVWLNLPYQYVGNAGLIIKGYTETGYTERNPDYVHVGGKRKLIELFGERWHEITEEPSRLAFFKEYGGYETLVIWGKELGIKNRKKLVRKLLEFEHGI